MIGGLVCPGEFGNGTVAPFHRRPRRGAGPRAVPTIVDVSGVACADSGLLRFLELSGAAGTLRITPDVEAARRVCGRCAAPC